MENKTGVQTKRQTPFRFSRCKTLNTNTLDELDAIIEETDDSPVRRPELQDTQRGMGRGNQQTTITEHQPNDGRCTSKLNPAFEDE